MDDLTIRLGEERDIFNIAAFSSKMAEETEALHLDLGTVQKGVEAVVSDPDKGFYLVAEKGNHMIGQLAIVFEWSDWSNNHFWLMQGVYVDKEHRGQKVFSHLFRRMVEMAKERRDVAGLRFYVAKDNEPAKPIYGSLCVKNPSHHMYEMEF
jgi:GNAT superfamily N-acetyltransferase